MAAEENYTRCVVTGEETATFLESVQETNIFAIWLETATKTSLVAPPSVEWCNDI